MKNIKLTERQLFKLECIIEKERDDLIKGMNQWTEFGEIPPKYMQEEYSEITELLNTLYSLN